MADGIYTAMTGAVARLRQLDSISDNLANSQTPGFKASRPSFESFLPANPNSDKVSTAATANALDLSPGPTVRTENPNDLLPENGAFFPVEMVDGTIGFTRDGRVTVGDDDFLYMSNRRVLDRDNNPISVPRNAQIEFKRNGEVWADGVRGPEIGRYALSGQIDRVSGTVLAVGPGGAAMPVESEIQSGATEQGNSSALESTVELINAQRNFDAAMQAITTYRRMDEKAIEVGRVR